MRLGIREVCSIELEDIIISRYGRVEILYEISYEIMHNLRNFLYGFMQKFKNFRIRNIYESVRNFIYESYLFRTVSCKQLNMNSIWIMYEIIRNFMNFIYDSCMFHIMKSDFFFIRVIFVSSILLIYCLMFVQSKSKPITTYSL